MEKWIKELGENAKCEQEGRYSKGDLILRSTVYYESGIKYGLKIQLEGEFTADQLEALAKHMRKHKEKE